MSDFLQMIISLAVIFFAFGVILGTIFDFNGMKASLAWTKRGFAWLKRVDAWFVLSPKIVYTAFLLYCATTSVLCSISVGFSKASFYSNITEQVAMALVGLIGTLIFAYGFTSMWKDSSAVGKILIVFMLLGALCVAAFAFGLVTGMLFPDAARGSYD